jgi:hypothetical protein
MPPVLAGLIIASLLGHGHTLYKTVRTPPTAVHGKTPVTYTATASPWNDALEREATGTCSFQFLVRVTGRGPVRLRLNGAEQILDESWAWKHEIAGGRRAWIDVEFVHPRTGFTLAEKRATFTCRARHASTKLEMASVEDF